MKKLFLLLVLNFILVMAQSGFLVGLLGPAASPNLPLAFAAALLLANRLDAALLSGLLGGLMLDFVGTSLMGIAVFLVPGCIYVSHLFRRYVYRHIAFQAILLFFFVILIKLALSFPILGISSQAFFAAIGTLVFWLLFYWIIRSFGRQ